MSRLAIVLAGGAARGAYEVGVVQYVLEEMPKTFKRDIDVSILCGTSVGALNACGLAAFAHLGRTRARELVRVWTTLDVRALLKVDTRGITDMGSRLLGRSPLSLHTSRGLLDPEGIERVVEREIPFDYIPKNLADGRLEALTVSATHVASGRTVVFVQRADGTLPPWSLDPTIEPRAVEINSEHALASAAIPMLFRCVTVGGEWFCDGGLRQNVPLSPARKLGARGVLVVNPRYVVQKHEPPTKTEAPPGPLFVLGKALNALLLDRIDTDLARLEGINRILAAGERRFGKEFVTSINEEMGLHANRAMRPMESILIRASRDIGKLAAECVRSTEFQSRAGRVGRMMRALADRDDFDQADLLSYVMFDGPFAKTLIDMGFEDAKARHDEIGEFLEKVLTG